MRWMLAVVRVHTCGKIITSYYDYITNILPITLVLIKWMPYLQRTFKCRNRCIHNIASGGESSAQLTAEIDGRFLQQAQLQVVIPIDHALV